VASPGRPLAALACWFNRVASYARIKRGVFAAVEAGVSQALAAYSLGPIGQALALLLDAGKADETIRPDVDARDVILLIGYLTRLEQAEWDTRARHLLQVVLDGLRSREAEKSTSGLTGLSPVPMWSATLLSALSRCSFPLARQRLARYFAASL
jgi:hypothetical protein